MLIRSDARAIPLADNSVHCVVTSPPYWGLRKYSEDPTMIGLEPTLEEHLENLVVVFREVRRVLRPDGVLWLNYGDAHTSGNRSTYRSGASDNKGHQIQDDMPRPPTPKGLKPKDLMMMPARLALALQTDGWWIRSEIVWHKPNPMPESVTDRPTQAHEKVYLMSKSSRYFYDAEGVRTPRRNADDNRVLNAEGKGLHNKDRHDTEMGHAGTNPNGPNLRNVWKIATQGVKEAHYATFPEKLVEPCILAGTSEKGCCPECGAPWERALSQPTGGSGDWSKSRDRLISGSNLNTLGGQKNYQNYKRGQTTGWKPTCDHGKEPVPCKVLDPFAGSGTVVQVAERFNRIGIGCDLAYQDIALKRTRNIQRMLI